jgi:hypothetical protein
MQDKPVKVCPLCKSVNDAVLLHCVNCGVPLEVTDNGASTQEYVRSSLQKKIQGANSKDITLGNVPEIGLGIYINQFDRPDIVTRNMEFFLGRKTEGFNSDNLIDLNPFGALDQGVSRRHVRIYRAGDSYRCMDLESRNGSWIDNQHLVPKVAYSISTRTQLRLGNFTLFLAYRQPTHSPHGET